MSRTAAIVVIGNEVLSGKVREENAAYLIGRLRELGTELKRVSVVPDEQDAIVEAVTTARRFDHVICSGGIGPTHDDITVASVARALGVHVTRSEALVALIEAHHQSRGEDGTLPAAAYRLADVPQGARLIQHAGLWYPAIAVGEIYLLPGVPLLFRRQFEALSDRFRDAPFFLRNLYLSAGEVSVTAALDAVVARHPQVLIGSYPRFDEGADHRVKLTVEAREQALVDAAFSDLRATLPPGAILRED